MVTLRIGLLNNIKLYLAGRTDARSTADGPKVVKWHSNNFELVELRAWNGEKLRTFSCIRQEDSRYNSLQGQIVPHPIHM